MSEIKVKITQASYSCILDIGQLDSSKASEIRFQVMNRWDTIDFHINSITLFYYQFKRVLPAIANWCKINSITLVFDDSLKQLIQAFAQDRRGFKGERFTLPVDFKGVQSTLDSVGFQRTLTDKQVEDVTNLVDLYHGANFSVPGAGKTTSLLAIHSILKAINRVNKMLVICPINAFISWEDEVQEIYKGEFTIQRLNKSLIETYSAESFPEADIYITNYEKFRGGIDGLSKLFNKNKVHLVLDESHRIKSGFSNQSYSQIVQLGDFSVRRDIMSGTPMPQSFSDIESQFEFLWPTEKVVPSDTDDPNISSVIHEKIKKFYVRTTKNDLQLEPVEYISTEVEMGPIQRELYDLIRSESARMLTRMDRETLGTFRFLGRCVIRLMQASTNPMLLTSNEDIYDNVEGIPPDSEVWNLLEEYSKYEKPAKFTRLQDRVEQILSSDPTAKVLIWSVFVKNILLLNQMFSEFEPAVIYGGVSSSGDDSIEESREGQIRKFHENSDCRVMIANPQACGEGISLHRVCHHAIYLERNYNAAHYLQSMDRIHRFGLRKGTKTKIELLLASNSLDQRIDQRLREKIAAMSEVLNDEFLQRMAYDPYDVDASSISGVDDKDIEDIRSYFTDEA